MKKLYLFLFTFLILPFSVFAVSSSSVNYNIKHHYINAYIRDNGDLDVEELIVLKGSFNGYEKRIAINNSRLNSWEEGNIDFSNSSIYNMNGVKLNSISAKYVDDVSFETFDENGFDNFTETYYANAGDKGVYLFGDNYDSKTYRMYYETKHDQTAFLIKYTLDDAVVMHNDVAELYWQIIIGDSSYNDSEKDVKVKVYLPSSDASDYFRFWAHGSLTGNIKKINSEDVTGVYLTIDKLEKSDDMDVRITFDSSLITDDYSLDHSNQDAFDEILKVEKKRADEANKERKKLKLIYNIFKYVSITIFGFYIVSFIRIKIKKKQLSKVDFDAKYYREFIDDYNVEVIDYLFKKNVTPNALSAAIMNLVYKKNISVVEVVGKKEVTNPKKKVYEFTLVSRENLSESDIKMVDFLFETVGSENKFTTKQLKDYASSTKTGGKFNSTYESWRSKVISEGKKQDFYTSKKCLLLLPCITIISTFITYILSGVFGAMYFLITIDFVLMFVLGIYLASMKLYSKKGSLHLKKWKAFKNFLNDFGSFDEKELPEIHLWERYLVYAVIFGIADKVQKVMNVKISEIDPSQSMDTFTNIYIYNSINSSFSTAVTEGRQKYLASRANAYSSSSSGGGFGGGFSGGGGFGGGGGGGHGF